MIRNILATSTIISMIFACPMAADAFFVMTLNDLSTPGIDVVIVDNSDGGVGTATASGASNTADANGIDGIVGYSGLVGSFYVAASIGVSAPVIPGVGVAVSEQIHLTNLTIAGGAGSLEIMVTDTDYWNLPDTPSFISQVGGLTSGSVDWSAHFDPTNTEFGAHTPGSVNLGSTGLGGVFADYQSAPIPFGGATPFSMTFATTITHTGAGQVTSIDADAGVAPESSALMIWVGLAAIGFSTFWDRRRFSGARAFAR